MAGYRILSFLFAWMIPNHITRNKFRQYCEGNDLAKDIKAVQKQYKENICNIKNSSTHKVIFLVNDNNKWKTQSLYDLMKESSDFEPQIIISLAEKQRNLPVAEKQDILNENIKFFEEKGMQYSLGWNIKTDKAIPLNSFSPEIVFYQQPWGIPNNQKPKNVSKYALTCYVPYFVPNYGILSMDCRTFHKYLFRYYVLNDDWKALYKEYMKEFNENLKTVGHTALDPYYKNSNITNSQNYIIYAPHWSIKHSKNENDTNYSTFDKFGQTILNYAKNHPEQKWLFKPHPKLRSTLEQIGIMNRSDIDKYYTEWEEIGTVCYDGNYTDLFQNSKVLITDCGSFLVEYFCTGNPLIHLISDQHRKNIPLPFQKILNSYYKVNTEQDLLKYLDEIIIENKDPKALERENLREELHLANTYAAKNIIQDLRKVING